MTCLWGKEAYLWRSQVSWAVFLLPARDCFVWCWKQHGPQMVICFHRTGVIHSFCANLEARETRTHYPYVPRHNSWWIGSQAMESQCLDSSPGSKKGCDLGQVTLFFNFLICNMGIIKIAMGDKIRIWHIIEPWKIYVESLVWCLGQPEKMSSVAWLFLFGALCIELALLDLVLMYFSYIW